MQCVVFQKQSPHLDEMNSLIDMAKQMGLIHMSYYNLLPNATKCNTIGDVYKSHAEQNQTVIVKVNDIYGMLVLLGLGVGGALLVFIAEIVLLVSVSHDKYRVVIWFCINLVDIKVEIITYC